MKNCVDIRAFPEKYGVVMSHLNSVSRILKGKKTGYQIFFTTLPCEVRVVLC